MRGPIFFSKAVGDLTDSAQTIRKSFSSRIQEMYARKDCRLFEALQDFPLEQQMVLQSVCGLHCIHVQKTNNAEHEESYPAHGLYYQSDYLTREE